MIAEDIFLGSDCMTESVCCKDDGNIDVLRLKIPTCILSWEFVEVLENLPTTYSGDNINLLKARSTKTLECLLVSCVFELFKELETPRSSDH